MKAGFSDTGGWSQRRSHVSVGLFFPNMSCSKNTLVSTQNTRIKVYSSLLHTLQSDNVFSVSFFKNSSCYPLGWFYSGGPYFENSGLRNLGRWLCIGVGRNREHHHPKTTVRGTWRYGLTEGRVRRGDRAPRGTERPSVLGSE